MSHANLWSFTDPVERKLMATIRMVDGQIHVEMGEDHLPPPKLLDFLSAEYEAFKEHGANGGDEGFLRRLPSLITGTYIRAEFVKG